jgi:biotin transport system ATP-binding protein
MGEPLLEIKGLSHRFDDGSWGIRDISFSVEKEDFLIIAGKNGSGKTILMKHLNGLLRPTTGSVDHRGKPVLENLNETRRAVGLVFQNPDTQIVSHTVREEIAFGLENQKLPAEKIAVTVESVARALEMDHLLDRRTFTLSGGEKRKLTIAGVLVMEPEIVVLDEPLAGLDLPGIREVLLLLRRLHREGHAIVVISHELAKLLGLSSKLLLLDAGRQIYHGPPGGIIDRLEEYGVKGPDAETSPKEFLESTWLT